MKDEEILRLYRERSETALTETERQYGALCGTIARNILRNRQDAEECVNDTWHRAWNSIPPEEPRSLAAYLGRITRNLALNRLEKQNRQKRGGGEMTLIWEELGEMLPDRDTPEQHWERRAIAAALERFLRGLTPEERILFLRRYWWAEPVKTAAAHSGISPRRARSILERLRRDLRNELEKFWREEHDKAGYSEIRTPLIMNRALWERSGHWDHYHENMYFTEIDEAPYAIKPMNCPGGILLYLDEIQYFNKKQQQSLLEFMENGSITLIASTTENPYFYVYGALLSRSTVFEFKNVSAEEIIPAVERALGILKERSELPLSWEDDVPRVIAQQCGGDVRKAVSACELLYEAADVTNGELLLKSEDALQVAQRSAMRYDKGGDAMYDCASALMKSLRGSDPDAALHYLARFLEAGDLVTPCRRLLCSASEDVGMAYPQAIAIVKACVDTAMQLGLPEAQLPLAQAAVLLATAPKSNSVIEGIGAAWADVKAGKSGNFPRCLQNVHADSTGGAQGQNYKYPHAYPNHWVKQQYLPDELKNVQYYRYGDNKVERAAAQYWEAIKG